MAVKSKSSLTPKEIEDAIKEPVEAIEDELGDEETPGTIQYRLAQLEGGGSGGWTELDSSEWGTHQFAVGDKIRITYKKCLTSASVSSGAVSSINKTPSKTLYIMEHDVTNISGNVEFPIEIIMQGSTGVVAGYASIYLATGKLFVTRINLGLIAFVPGSATILTDTGDLTFTDYIIKVEYKTSS